MFFVFVTFTAAFALAVAAGFFSVAGLATTYGGSFAAVVALGSTIELGKLVAVSFLYRYWNVIGYGVRTLMSLMVIGVMVITSLGVFGFLTKANQVDTIALKQTTTERQLLEEEEQQLLERKRQIDKQIAELPTNSINGRTRLMSQFREETTQINERLPEIAKRKSELSQIQVEQQADVGPLIYLAKTLGYDVDIATTWFTLLLVAVFDPLAIMLTIAGNIIVKHRERVKKTDNSINTAVSLTNQPSDQSRVPDNDTQEIENSNVFPHMVSTITTTNFKFDTVSDPELQEDVSFFDLVELAPAAPSGPIFRDRYTEERVVDNVPQTVTRYADPIERSEQMLMKVDWNHYFNKQLSGVTPEILQEKLLQLQQYVLDLDAQTELTDDEIILRSRILDFLSRQQKK